MVPRTARGYIRSYILGYRMERLSIIDIKGRSEAFGDLNSGFSC